MADPHRTNVFVSSCLKTPVDPRTRAPLASYERGRALPCTAGSHKDNRDYEKELESEDSGSDLGDEDYVGDGGPLVAGGERLDLSQIFFSNEEYYSKLEELKRAHLRTMAELEGMYRRKLQLRRLEPLEVSLLEAGRHRLPWSLGSPAASRRLRKSHSAVELRRASAASDSSDEEEVQEEEVEKGLQFSPKEHIKNMWSDFKLPLHHRHLSASSTHSLPTTGKTAAAARDGKAARRPEGKDDWRHRLTVPKPFHMTVREAERRKRGVKTRSEIEHENAELRRQLEELTECQRKFHASPVPAHVHLPLYGELRERHEEERRRRREDARSVQKPFSFLERERLKKEQKQLLRPPPPADRDAVKPFKAKPVPRAVYAAAAGDLMKEEQLYRSIKIQMRAQEMLHSAAMPPSMLARRLSDRKKNKDATGGDDGDGFSHRPHVNKEVPDFDASYRRFQKNLEKRKEVKPTTACEPFELRTARITSHRERILADIEKEQSSPRAVRWPFSSPGPPRRANASLASSLSGSLELLPNKVTDASVKRHEAVRKELERRRRAEEEEEQWRERQRLREKKLQRLVLKKAQAHDPHLALAQTHHAKLQEFRKQEQQRRKEYQQEIREMQQRVKGRPLLLEQVAQRNAKQAAEKRYTDALHGCHLTEEFISSRAADPGPAHTEQSSDHEDPDMGYKPVHYRKVFLDDEDVDVDVDRGDGGDGGDGGSSLHDTSTKHSEQDDDNDDDNDDDDADDDDESYHYSDDHEDYSDDGEHDDTARRQEAGQ